jgi:hypothetical protein
MNTISITTKTETLSNVDLIYLAQKSGVSIYCDGCRVAIVNGDNIILFKYDNEFAYEFVYEYKVEHITDVASLLSL